MTIHSWEKLYLDDLSLGQQFESDSLRVHRASMLAFAQEFDPQPFHLDPEAAELSLFRGLAASGWNTAALTMKLLVESVPLADGIIGLSIELSWPYADLPGRSVAPAMHRAGHRTIQLQTRSGRGDPVHGNTQSKRQGRAASHRQTAGLQKTGA